MMRGLGLGILGVGLCLLALWCYRTSYDPYRESILGMVQTRVLYTYWKSAPSSRYLKLKDHKSLSGKLPYMIFPRSGSDSWVLYVPGIFSYLDSPFVKYFSSQLHSRGHNVLLIPNTFTRDFIRAKPQFQPGKIRKEAALFCDLVKRVRKEQKIEGLIRLVGVSYGGLLGAAIAGSCPLPFSQLTLISPPLHLKRSMDQVFLDLEESRRSFQNILVEPEAQMFLKAGFWDNHYFQALFSRFFFDGLYYTLFCYQSLQEGSSSRLTDIAYGSPEYHHWQKSVSVESFYKKQIRKNYKTDPNSFQLTYWLTKSRAPVRVYASLDDPINRVEQWDDLKTQASKEVQFQLQLQGGHLGFIGSESFSRFLDKEMSEGDL